MCKNAEKRVRVECDDCGWRGPEEKLGRTLWEIHHLADRLTPGCIVPAGECPKCRACAYYPGPTAEDLAQAMLDAHKNQTGAGWRKVEKMARHIIDR